MEFDRTNLIPSVLNLLTEKGSYKKNSKAQNKGFVFTYFVYNDGFTDLNGFFKQILWPLILKLNYDLEVFSILFEMPHKIHMCPSFLDFNFIYFAVLVHQFTSTTTLLQSMQTVPLETRLHVVKMGYIGVLIIFLITY